MVCSSAEGKSSVFRTLEPIYLVLSDSAQFSFPCASVAPNLILYAPLPSSY